MYKWPPSSHTQPPAPRPAPAPLYHSHFKHHERIQLRKYITFVNIGEIYFSKE